jgi:hypothetical protein
MREQQGDHAQLPVVVEVLVRDPGRLPVVGPQLVEIPAAQRVGVLLREVAETGRVRLDGIQTRGQRQDRLVELGDLPGTAGPGASVLPARGMLATKTDTSERSSGRGGSARFSLENVPIRSSTCST